MLDEGGLRARWRNIALPLTPVEFRLLHTLLQHPGRVFSRASLLDAIYADFRDVSDRAIDSHVKNLRRKLQAALPRHDCITAVYGLGYRLDMPSDGDNAPAG